jgi:hypothetical protein
METPGGSYYGEIQGSKAPFARPWRIGSPMLSTQEEQQLVARLITDCINDVISLAGPITRLEYLSPTPGS